MKLDITNIAGIRRGSATIRPGINAVRSLNWQGKTSFIRSIETAMGTVRELTEGESEGQVRLETDDETYEVTLWRENGTVARSGNPYLGTKYDCICAQLYAFLDDDNEVRAAVRNGENLEEVLTRPLEFEDIDARIEDLKTERSRIESELDRAREAAQQLPTAQETVTQLENDLQALRDERDDIVDDQASDATAASDVRDDLSDARAERERLENRIDRLTDTADRIESELDDLREERDSIEIPDVDVDADVEALRADLNPLERDIELLQNLFSANKRVLEEGRLDVITDVDRELSGDTVECWVCGTESDRGGLESRVERLGDRLADLNEEAAEYRERIERIEEKEAAAEQARKRRRDLDREIDDLEGTLADRRESLERAREQHAAVESRIDDLSEQVAEGQDRLTDVQSDIKHTETQLEEARERLERLTTLADQTEPLEATLEEITADLEKLRGRKTRVKQEMRELFDDIIGDLGTLFETSFESARLTGTFDLVVARDGREISIDALSEGELELIGIVAALAGYEAYDVGERVPVLALDSIGALAERNLVTLVEYLDDRSEYLVFTAFPEHTAIESHEIDPSEWTVVTDTARQS